MKNLAKLNGAKALSKTEQKSVNGGGASKCMAGSCYLNEPCVHCIKGSSHWICCGSCGNRPKECNRW